MSKDPQIAVLLPCYNEEPSIQKVIRDFQKELPEAVIYVFDNNSTDKSAVLAQAAGAKVFRVLPQGKGAVVRSMFRQIEADVYIMTDSDDTYPAESVHQLMGPILAEEADMVTANRMGKGDYQKQNKRPFHQFGNELVVRLINRLFHCQLEDIMTGYRAFSKRFVKSAAFLSSGFEIETEMTLQALHRKLVIQEIPISYRDRQPGSFSKLNTFRDGTRVLWTILRMYKDYKPFRFFTLVAGFFTALGLGVGLPVVIEYIATGLVPKFPSAILASGCMVLAAIFFTSGLILDTLVKHSSEQVEVLINQNQA